jgi:hypothetical protein
MPHNVSNSLPKTYDSLKDKLLEIKKDIGGIGVTLDLWKHDKSGAHYSNPIDKIWKIENCFGYL